MHRSHFERVLPRLPALLAMVIGCFVILDTVGVFAHRPSIEPDLSTYLLPAVERERAFGAVYADFLDIKPPFTYAVFVPWVAIAGWSLVSIWALYVVLLIALLSGFWLALRQVLAPWAALVLFASTSIVVVFFVMLEDFLFPTEVLGLTMALWGLLLGARSAGRPALLVAATMLVTLAGQAKDVFVFLPLALLPIALAAGARVRALVAWIGGIVGAALATIVLLLWWGPGALSGYLDVVELKRSRFPTPTPPQLVSSALLDLQAIGSWLPFLWVFAIALVACALLGRRHRHQLTHLEVDGRRRSVVSWAWGLTFVTVWAGFLWQDADPLKYYALALIFPLALLLSVPLGWGLARSGSMSRPLRTALAGLLVIGLLPSVPATLWFLGRAKASQPVEDVSAIMASERAADLAMYRARGSLTPANGCLHVAYGWWASVDYLYSEAKPCTRFTAPPLAPATPELVDELRQALVARPPDVLVVDVSQRVTPNTIEGARESRLLPYDVLAAQCYEAVSGVPNTYRAIASGMTMRTCVETVLGAEGSVPQ